VAAKDLSLPLIVYVIVPNTFANLSHPSAAHVLSTMSDINDSLYNAPGRLTFHLIPEVFVSHSRSLSHNPDFGLERLALSVYDSVPRIVDREHSRLSSKLYSVRESIDAHAFVLANPRPKVHFVEKWPPPTASVFDRYAFLHVAYGVSTDGEWVTTSVITENGDKQENRIWRIEEDEPFVTLVKNVLDFTLKIARKADVEWRVTISKSGAMSTPEFEGEEKPQELIFEMLTPSLSLDRRTCRSCRKRRTADAFNVVICHVWRIACIRDGPSTCTTSGRASCRGAFFGHEGLNYLCR
jgi:mediator of RNA polymerase II transcription subunit 13